VKVNWAWADGIPAKTMNVRSESRFIRSSGVRVRGHPEFRYPNRSASM